MKSFFLVAATFLLVPVLGGCASMDRAYDAMMEPEHPAPQEMTEAAKPIDASSTRKLYLNAVRGLIDQGRYKAALAYLDQYAVSEKGGAEYLSLRGEALLGTGQYDAAVDTFTELAGTGRAADGYAGLGRVAAARGNWSEAAEHFGNAVGARPASAEYLNNLGYARLHLGPEALKQAEFNLRQAYELSPASTSIRNNLVLVLMMRGEKREAQRLIDGIATRKERLAVRDFARSWVKDQEKKQAVN